MMKKLIKSLLGERNTKRIRRVKQALNAAKTSWNNTAYTTSQQDKNLLLPVLMQVHMLEKALAVENMNYLDKVKYRELTGKIAGLIEQGYSPDDFETAGSVAVMRSALSTLAGHEADKAELEALITKYTIPANFKGGAEKLSRSEILKHETFGELVRTRHSVRKLKDKIISREVIYDIVRDAEYYPSACNRQPCKVYFSENRETVQKIIKCIPDQFVASGIHDALVVTCDRALLLPSEQKDQEYINGGIFLGYLVMSIHAHGLGACLFQFLQVSQRQAAIKKEFGIKDSEVIVAFVGIGELEDEIITACAARRPVESVAVNIDKD